MLNPQRTIDDLKELRALTGDENGAQRVAFTDTWLAARAFMCHKLKESARSRSRWTKPAISGPLSRAKAIKRC